MTEAAPQAHGEPATPRSQPKDARELIPDAARSGTRAALLACADTKLLLGYHYGEWTFGAPALEAAIAACSMGQDELGHARQLHGLLDHFYGLKQETLVEDRTGREFADVAFLDRPFGSWADLVAANALVDLGVTLEIAAYRGSSLGAFRRVVDKLVQEEKFHDEHGRAWVVLAAKRSRQSRETLARSIRGALPSVLAFLGPPESDHDRPLLEAGIKTRSAREVRDDFLARVNRLLEEAGFPVGSAAPGGELWPDDETLDWAAWDPDRRRTDPGGPSTELLEHLSGARNVEFRRT
jgi:phenylacetate-CoA oxygenase PaaI subunit